LPVSIFDLLIRSAEGGCDVPTITVRQFEYEELRRQLQPADKILIISCNACARQSDGLGGEEGLQRLSARLTADGYRVHHRELVPVACSLTLLKDRLEDEKARGLLHDADIVIPLACRAGEERIGETLPGIHMIRVTKTLGKGSYSPETGALLTDPLPDIGLEIEDPMGMLISNAAKQLGLPSGSF
jgi:hypothetical protein